MDREKGTDYHERLKNWILGAEKKGLVVAGALTDAKGDRSRKPSQQKNRDTNLHISERREDGLIISGCKAMICGLPPVTRSSSCREAATAKRIWISL